MSKLQVLEKLMFSCFLCIHCNTSLFAGWHDRKAEGWAWYEDLQKPEQEKPQPKPPLTSAEEMQQIRQSIEEKLAKAVIEPTLANIRSYMEEQQKWVEQSSYFAQVWAQVLLTHPQLDYTATDLPVSQYGLQFYKKDLQDKKEELILSLAQEYGLFFFYEGQSETSLIFGQIVHQFCKKYELEMIAVSLDGIEMKGFEGSKTNNGIAETLGIEVTPALYLINPKTNVVIPIAFGLVAMDKIEDNIMLQFKKLVK